MKKRSPSFPSKNIVEAKRFSISVFENVGETVLPYAELAKKGEVAVREADSFAVSSSQYGFMKIERGKGYGAVAKVCSALRLPKEGEENALYLNAFISPPLYKTIISLFNGKKITEQGLIIDLVRDHEFGDTGAKIAAKVFIENVQFLGLIDTDGILNVDAEIKIDPQPIKGKKGSSNEKQSADKKNSTSKRPEAGKRPESDTTSSIGNSSNGNMATKKIPIFIRGQELHFPVLEGMNQSDWDAVIKQLSNIKAYSK